MILYANAYAKINLSLDITSVLPNGYHALNTVMQSVSLCDRVRLQTGTPGLSLRCDAPDVPTDDRNTAFVAAKLFYDAIKKAPETEIEIQKNIPSQAGLGGGSADAAAVLRLLNAAYGLPLSEETLAALADRTFRTFDYLETRNARVAAMKAVVAGKIALFGSTGKAG